MAHMHTSNMLKTPEDAEAFVHKFCDFFDVLWSTKKEWDYEVLRALYADNVQVGWQGLWAHGMKNCFNQWQPVQHAVVQTKTLSFDIHAFSETMVSFTMYQLSRTWDEKDMFIVCRCVIDIDNKGHVVRQNGTAKQKYADLFNQNLDNYRKNKKRRSSLAKPGDLFNKSLSV